MDATIQSDPAPSSDPPTPFDDPKPPQAAPTTYEWDRTPAEADKRLEDDRIRKTPFPLPAAKTLQFPEFCKYWNTLLSNPVSKYARLYIRRWFPVLLPDEIEMPSGLTKEVYPSEKTYHPTDGPLSELKLLSFVGVGDYTIRLNDTRLPFVQATIVHCEKFCTQRDWDHYPPLMDVDRLDWDDAANQVYIKFAQSRGIFRRDDERREDKEAMAQASIVDTALSDARAERARTDRLNQEAITRLEREVKEARDAEAKAKLEVKAEVKPSAPAGELLSVVTAVATLAQSLQPPKDDSLTKYLDVQAKREEAQLAREKEERDVARTAAAAERKRADDLQASLLADLQKRAEPPAPGTVVAPPTRRQVIEDAIAEQRALKEFAKGGPAMDEEEKPSRVDKWLEAAPILAPIVQSVVGGIFQTIHFGLTTWQQVSYNAALAKNGEPKAPTTMEKPPEPGKPIQPAGPQPTPEQQAANQRLIVMLNAMEDAATPILMAFSSGESGDPISAGATFAQTIINYKGRPDYDLLRSLGEKPAEKQGEPNVFDFEQFRTNIAFLMDHPNRGPKTKHLASEVAQKPSFRNFLAGLFGYDELLAKAQEQEDQK